MYIRKLELVSHNHYRSHDYPPQLPEKLEPSLNGQSRGEGRRQSQDKAAQQPQTMCRLNERTEPHLSFYWTNGGTLTLLALNIIQFALFSRTLFHYLSFLSIYRISSLMLTIKAPFPPQLVFITTPLLLFIRSWCLLKPAPHPATHWALLTEYSDHKAGFQTNLHVCWALPLRELLDSHHTVSPSSSSRMLRFLCQLVDRTFSMLEPAIITRMSSFSWSPGEYTHSQNRAVNACMTLVDTVQMHHQQLKFSLSSHTCLLFDQFNQVHKCTSVFPSSLTLMPNILYLIQEFMSVFWDL